MKYAIVVMDGAADEPLAELGGLTVLEKARIPHTDWITRRGRLGLVRTVPEGFAPGCEVALMSVLGYDPEVYHKGRAPLEAAARGIRTGPEDWIFRCNLVTTADGLMVDCTAGRIETVQAFKLMEDLNERLSDEKIRFYPGESYRHLMVYRGGNFNSELASPYDIIDKPIAKYLPRGRHGKILSRIMEQAAKILQRHQVNQVRLELGENQASNIWLWGQGRQGQLESFRRRFGQRGAVITGVDLLRGLARLAGMKIVQVEGATGYLDTNYQGKGEAALAALAENDLVLVHAAAPDEAGHEQLAAEKVEAVERIDKYIVGPLLERLQGQREGRIMVLPDHSTPIGRRTHTEDPVPFTLAGAEIVGAGQESFSEANAAESGFRIEKGYELMEYFLKVKR
ncbi:MAG: hypothetical protein AMJ79_11365 [Phycisphaerae bacterium SM23_30]|nr:MAG: hypothetical protein AMJ79_11365 [Phycisphaerae bacterium SM23_30]